MINVLIAEDDFRVAQIHEQYLEHVTGMRLIGKAMNAKETLQLLRENKVDLLLLDVYMPDVLGTELLEQIRKEHDQVDVIMITAANDRSFLKKAMGYGVYHYLVKPITLAHFTEVLTKYTQKKKMLESITEVNQEVLDHVFGLAEKVATKSSLPSGIDYITLKKVSEILGAEIEGITAETAGEKMGASRTTARRYLEYLVGVRQAKVEQVYGIVGRPERRYFSKEK